jgi:hypothetical protein
VWIARSSSFVLQVLGSRSVPCPTLDLSGGFRAYIDTVTGIKSTPPFDPFKNDVNFLLATFSLEEISATGDKVRAAYNSVVTNLRRLSLWWFVQRK